MICGQQIQTIARHTCSPVTHYVAARLLVYSASILARKCWAALRSSCMCRCCTYLEHLLGVGHVVYGIQDHNQVEGWCAWQLALGAIGCSSRQQAASEWQTAGSRHAPAVSRQQAASRRDQATVEKQAAGDRQQLLSRHSTPRVLHTYKLFACTHHTKNGG
jgi:hypothetical protein